MSESDTKQQNAKAKHLLNLCHCWHSARSHGIDHVKMCQFLLPQKSKDMSVGSLFSYRLTSCGSLCCAFQFPQFMSHWSGVGRQGTKGQRVMKSVFVGIFFAIHQVVKHIPLFGRFFGKIQSCALSFCLWNSSLFAVKETDITLFSTWEFLSEQQTRIQVKQWRLFQKDTFNWSCWRECDWKPLIAQSGCRGNEAFNWIIRGFTRHTQGQQRAIGKALQTALVPCLAAWT